MNLRILYTLLLILLTSLLIAQQKDSMSVLLEDVIIRENRLELPFSEASRSITVITRAEIEAAPAISVPELLQYVAGVDIRQRGVHGVQTDVSIRGGTFDQTLVLINGIKMSDPQTGHHAMNLPIDIENIERIEVLKGPGARVFGQNAFAGAINIITKTPEEQFVKVKLQAGQNGLLGFRGSAAYSNEKSNHYISFSKDHSDGYRFNTDYDINNFFYQADGNVFNNELRLIAGFTERAFGANQFYGRNDSVYRNQYEEISTSLLALEYRILKQNWVIKPRAYWRRNHDDYLFMRNMPDGFRNIHTTNVAGLEINTSYGSAWGTTGIGIDLNRVNINSTNLGIRERIATSIFLEHRFSWLGGKMDVTPGVLFNHFSDFEANLLPGVEVGYQLTEKLRTYGSIGYTYRVPTYTDLYYDGPGNKGNALLQPESAVSSELGLKYNTRNLNIQLGAFVRNGQNLIDWTRASEDEDWRAQNFNAINMTGLEFAGLLKLEDNLLGISSLDVSYTYIDATFDNGDVAFSQYVLENLRHQFIFGLEEKITKQLFANVRFRYLDRVNLKDYSLVDLRLLWRGNRLDAFLEATNLLDETYRETNLVTMPGRWIRAGVGFTF
ncbi:MAG: TonB-dependent receptor [Bacteroidota bacterium]